MSFFSLTTVRRSACAAVLLLALATPAHASDLEDKSIIPGQTLFLEASGEGALVVNESLPAGWSAIASDGGLRITAPATAKESEAAEVQVIRAGEVIDEFDVIVGDPELADAEATDSSGNSSSSGWFDSLRERIHSFFG